MLQNTNDNDNLALMSIFQDSFNPSDDQNFNTLWTEVGSGFDVVDIPDDYDLLTVPQLQSRCKDAEKKCRYLEEKVAEMKKEHIRRNELSLASSGRKQDNSLEIEEYKDENNDLRFKVKHLESDIRKLKRDKVDNLSEIQQMKDEMEELEMNFKSLQRKYKEKIKEVNDSDHKNEIDDLKKKLKEAMKKVKEMDDAILELKIEMDDAQRKCSDLKAERQKMSGDMRNQNELNENLQKTVEDLQRLLGDKRDALNTLREKLKVSAESEVTVEALKLECHSKQNIIDMLTEENQRICQSKMSLEQSVDFARQEMYRMQEKRVRGYPLWWEKHMV